MQSRILQKRQTFKRVSNILRKQGVDAPKTYARDLFSEQPEFALAEALDALDTTFDGLWKSDRFEDLFALLGSIRPVVDAFFDGVMVMDENPAVRANRLGLLHAVLARMEKLADFSALQI